MKKLLAAILILGAGAWFFRGKLFASMPPVTISKSHVLVGQPPGDHALYGLNAPCEIHAASVGYEFNSSILGDFFRKLGSRGVISFMDPALYKANHDASVRAGTCMAGGLNECQRNGQIQHLFLIPQDAAAFDQMRAATIRDGQNFHLRGRYLAFQEGTLGGHPFNGQISGTGYFLVESIGPD